MLALDSYGTHGVRSQKVTMFFFLQNMMRRRNTQKFFVSIFVATREARTFAVKGELPELTEIRHNFFESRRKGTAARRTGHDQSGGK